MTDILKFQQLLNSVKCKFTVFYCQDEYAWKPNEPGDNTVRDYIAMQISEASDIHIVFDNLGNFVGFAHHG